MAQAGIAPPQVAFINAHGTGTLDNDRVEAGVIARIFGASTPFLSTKGHTGHTLGAAGGLEAVFTVLGLRHRLDPRRAGFENQGNDIPVAPVPIAPPSAGHTPFPLPWHLVVTTQPC